MTHAKTLDEVKQEIAEIMKRPGAPVTEKTTPMSKLKQPIDVDDYYATTTTLLNHMARS